MTLWGAIEFGGTKTLAAVGSGHELSEVMRWETAEPPATLRLVTDWLKQRSPTAVGIACFGPLDLDPLSERFGSIGSTPKADWSNTEIVRHVESALGVKVSIDTDVNAAAIGEWAHGAARGVSTAAYVTVGTGIGAGLAIDGSTIKGPSHPEWGHVVVRRHPSDDYPGSCPFHRDCLEGMACGPALGSRIGVDLEQADQASQAEMSGLAAFYVGQGLRNLIYTAAPEAIVVGGGVTQLPDFHSRLTSELEAQLAGYPETPPFDESIVRRPLFEDSGLVGAMTIAAG